ncbi:MAG: YjgP/YjgQ family permease [Zetaproteobacteria bacterium]|nr:MAG: YjgP/YjgQ family permease [Zetaproteobacteria bacterium]
MVLDRYILRLWWQPFVGMLLLVTAVLLLGRALKLLGLFAAKSIDWSLLGTMLAAITPYFLVLTLPIAFFFAALHLLIRLQQENELDALQAAGIDPLRLLRPLFVVAILLWLLLTWTALEWMPQGQKAFQTLLVAITKLKAAPSFQPQRIDRSLEHLTVYIQGRDATGTMHGLLLEDARYREPVIYIAQSAELVRAGGRLSFILHHGTRLEGSGDDLRTVSFVRYRISEDAGALGLLKLPQWGDRAFEMDFAELRHALQRTPGRPDLIAELHRRLLLPATILILALFALPLAIQPKRSARATPYLAGIGLILLLYNGQILLHQLVLNGRAGPWVMWLGQGLFLALGGWLFQRVRTGHTPQIMVRVEQLLGALGARLERRLARRW